MTPLPGHLQAGALRRALGLNGHSAWLTWAKSGERPPDIPTDPLTTYQGKGWIGWGDWLGTGTVGPHDYEWRPFEEARTYARGLGLMGQVAYQRWAKSESRPDDIPTNP